MYQRGFREAYVYTNHSATFHLSTLNKAKIIFKTCLSYLKKIFMWTLKDSKKSDEVSRKSEIFFHWILTFFANIFIYLHQWWLRVCGVLIIKDRRWNFYVTVEIWNKNLLFSINFLNTLSNSLTDNIDFCCGRLSIIPKK